MVKSIFILIALISFLYINTIQIIMASAGFGRKIGVSGVIIMGRLMTHINVKGYEDLFSVPIIGYCTKIRSFGSNSLWGLEFRYHGILVLLIQKGPIKKKLRIF